MVTREERMPFKEGWRPTNRIDGLVIAQGVVVLALNTPEKVVPGAGSGAGSMEELPLH